ncbi:6-phosphogluconolactonase [Candidatus Laterigemmans baculatus]|uniref:6-phosphogluconolactonase n=1 Tax=Candidatus Laterigemmans baculatus TaxID=2770505 RepID=UPI0013D91DF9|nr:6-phosphogluconolactonase [Candidatus Laterigemmans baculatus]
MQPSVGTLHTYDAPHSMLDAIHRELVALIEKTVEAQGVCRISLSGGSTPKQLYQRLGASELPWDRIEWYWGDERNVPPGDAESNYRMVREAMLDQASVPASQVFPVPIQIEDPAAAARQYEATLREQFGDGSWPRFDLILLGMGDDAHTASLFPETDALSADGRWFVENWVPKFDAYRLTMTAPVINAAANVWFLITGENKRTALAQVWGSERNPEQYPSQLVAPSDGELRWFVGREAVPE